MSDSGPTDADRLLDIDLPHSFRGLDPEAVQGLLSDAVESLRAAHRREEELRTTITELEAALVEARGDADAQLDEARRRGRAMVDEAQTVRRRILEDLVRRRKVLRRQIEQLRVGRERLLEAYDVVSHTVEEATHELNLALPEAQAAAGRVGRRLDGGDDEVTDEDLYVMEAEIDAARVAGLPIVGPRTAAERAAVQAEAEETVPPLTEVEPVVAAFEEVRLLGPQAGDEGDGDTPATVDEDEAEPHPDPPVLAVVEEEAPEAAEPAVEEAEAEESEAEVLPLFERLRAAEPEPAELVEVAEADPEADPIEALPAEEDEGTEDAADVLAEDLARRLRRALADEQNQVLDRIRQDRKGQLAPADLLGDGDARVVRLATAVEPRLREAVGETDDGRPADLAARLAGAVADGVRADVERELDRTDDPEELVRPVREAFRAWRTDRLLPLAAEVAAEVQRS